MGVILYYAHDPMCSWCWAFRPAWARIRARLPATVTVQRVLGGLAPDSDSPMPEPMRDYLQQTWRRIQTRVPGTRFNFDFWQQCEPRRSTYPACRAVLAAAALDPACEEPMIDAIQEAYYLQARNPSDDVTLIAIAGALGLNTTRFGQALNAPPTRAELLRQIEFARRIGAHGFPSLILEHADGQRMALPLDPTDPEVTLARLAPAPQSA